MWRSEFGFVFYLHLALILLVLASPWLVPWWVILIGILIYYLQLKVFGHCLLTALQTGSRKRTQTFWGHYLERLGLPINQRKMIVFTDYFLPWLILAFALYFQLWVG
ncbi:MAG TPA: hypothetical protein VI953_00940 [Candidatus Paceibacterota bacterium]